MNEQLNDAIKKVAMGYSLQEVTEEYGVEDGEVKLLKRKETRKDVPPDLKAVKMLLEESGQDFSSMSDEELNNERKRLLAELAKEQE